MPNPFPASASTAPGSTATAGRTASPATVALATSNSIDRRRGVVLWAFAFCVAFGLYAATADRGVQWQDSGWQQLRIVTGEFQHPLGLALMHPLQYDLGRAAIRLAPFEPALAITLVSSLAGAIAVANLAAVLLLLTRSFAAAAIASAAFMLSHTFWQHATHTESYAIVGALLTAEWLCLACYARTSRGRFLVLLALFNGLGIANHLLATLATPVDCVVLLLAVRRRHLSPRGWAAAALLWLVGTLPYSSVVISTGLQTADWSGTLSSAFFGRYAHDVLNAHLTARTLLLSAGFVLYNFPGLALPLAIIALFARLEQPKLFTRAVKFELALYALFVFRYSIRDQYSFFFPVYGLLALFAGLGLAHVLRRNVLSRSPSTHESRATNPPRSPEPAAQDDREPSPGMTANLASRQPQTASRRQRAVLVLTAATVLWTPLVYAGSAAILSSRGAIKTLVGNKPYRDGYQAFLVPWGVGKGYAEQLNHEAFKLAGRDGLIFYEDDMISFALRYAQAVGQAPASVTVMHIEGKAAPAIVDDRETLMRLYLMQGRPVVLVPRDRDRPTTCVAAARWKRVGELYLLKEVPGPEDAAPDAAANDG